LSALPPPHSQPAWLLAAKDFVVRSLRVSLAASALAVALPAGDASAQFTNIYFFGDSLTDAGSFRPVLPPGTGLFTTNPGLIWAQVLAARYGLTTIPANQGGTDFAQGGARVTGLPGVPATPPTGTAAPIATQVSQLTARGPLDSGALYAVWVVQTTSSSSLTQRPPAR